MKLLGKGATAEVFEYGSDKVLKLYNEGESEDSLMWEYNKLKLAHSNHVPCPEVFEVVKINKRMGYVMEKYSGLTINQKLERDIQKLISGEISNKDFTIRFFDNIKGVAKALYEVHKVRLPW